MNKMTGTEWSKEIFRKIINSEILDLTPLENELVEKYIKSPAFINKSLGMIETHDREEGL